MLCCTHTALLNTHTHNQKTKKTKKELPEFYLVNAYVPNADGVVLSRLDYRVGEWDPAFASYIRTLAIDKPVVVAGEGGGRGGGAD